MATTGYYLTEADKAFLNKLKSAFDGGKLEALLRGDLSPISRQRVQDHTIILEGVAALGDDANQTPICELTHPWNGKSRVAYNFHDEPSVGERIQIAWHGVEPPETSTIGGAYVDFAPAAKWRLVEARAGHLTGTLYEDLNEGGSATLIVDKLNYTGAAPVAVVVYEVIGCALAGDIVVASWNRGMLRYEAIGAKCECSSGQQGGGGGDCSGSCTWVGVADSGSACPCHWTLESNNCAEGCTCVDPNDIGIGHPLMVGQHASTRCGDIGIGYPL